MRKILLLALTLFSAEIFAQAPEGINYQAVARDVSGAEMPNTPVAVQIEILNAALVAVYQEDHSTTTNAFGLFNVVIGQGANPTSAFSSIDWANGPFYLRVNIDANGSGYVNMGYTQLWSVPYALYAKESANGPQGLPGISCWDLDGDGVNDPAEDVNSDLQWNALDCQGPTGAAGATGPTGQQGSTGANGINGTNCWDTDNDGVQDASEDINTDGLWNALDCAGATGPTGAVGASGINGTNCWDTDNDGVQDVSEDINTDGLWNSLDCVGATGPTGAVGSNGINGTNCWDTDNDGIQDAGEDINTDGLWNSLDCVGATGPTGLQGLQGPIGPSGPQGTQGPAGPTGTFSMAGTFGQTLYYNTAWSATSNLYNDGTNIGIGTTSPLSRLHVDLFTSTANSTSIFGSFSGSGAGNNVAINGSAAGTGTGNYYGLYGQGNNASGSGTVYGVWGVGYGSGSGIRYGVYGAASIQVAGQTGYGVYAAASGLAGIKYALYADATGSRPAYADWFEGGDVHVKNNVSIGTTSNSEKLTVADQSSTTSTAAISVIGGTNGVAAIAFGSGTNAYLGEVRYDNSTNSMHFWTGNTYRMIINGNGNVGIGNNFTTPQSQLHMHAGGVTQMQMTNSNTGAGSGDGLTLGIDNASTVNITNQEGGGFKFKDGANSPVWISGSSVGINAPFQPLYALMVYNNVGHQALQVGNSTVTIGDVDNTTAGNYLYVDHSAATPKFMFYGASTAFGTTAAPTSTVFIQGGTSSNTTHAMKIQNASSTVHFAVRDDGKTGIGSTATSPTSTLDVSGSFALSNQITVASASTTISLTSDQSVVFIAANNITVTLPAASSCKGRMVWIKQTSAFLNTVVASGGGNVEGSVNYTISGSGSRRACMFMSDGANWWMMTTIL